MAAPACVVGNLGSANFRVGWSGQGQPDHVLARPRDAGAASDGQQQQQQRARGGRRKGRKGSGGGGGGASPAWPVDRGVVTSWDAFEERWQTAFSDVLQTPSTDQPLLVADSISTPEADRNKTAELMFERFEVPAFFAGYDSVLSVFSAGRTSSVVVDCGAQVMHGMAVHDGFAHPPTLRRSEVGSDDVTEYLQGLLNERGAGLAGPEGFCVANAIKEKHGRIALDFAQDSHRAAQEGLTYTLPDGRAVALQADHLRACEVLLQPALIGRKGSGVADMLWDVASACLAERESSPLRALPEFMLLVGGSCMLEGLGQRASSDITSRVRPTKDLFVSFVSEAERWHAAWVGGSILASLPSFVDNNFVSRAEYDEVGVAAVNKRCC